MSLVRFRAVDDSSVSRRKRNCCPFGHWFALQGRLVDAQLAVGAWLRVGLKTWPGNATVASASWAAFWQPPSRSAAEIGHFGFALGHDQRAALLGVAIGAALPEVVDEREELGVGGAGAQE